MTQVMERQTKTQRLDIRTSTYVKSVVTEAAKTLGISTSDFVMQAAFEKSQEVLELARHWAVTREDWETVGEILEHPARVTPEMIEAVKAAREL